MTASLFPITRGRELGYSRSAADAFLARARAAFERQQDAPSMHSSTIRAAAFPMTKRGYRPADVDAALGRIEDAFAARERDAVITAGGAEQWVRDARARAQEILDRLRRGPGRRFRRAPFLRFGYARTEVDAVAERLIGFLQHGEAITPVQVRQVAFRMQRGGYAEEQVDALLDAVIEVLLAVAPMQAQAA